MRTACCGAEKKNCYGSGDATRRDQLVFGSCVLRLVVCFSFVFVDSFLGIQRAPKIKLQIRYVHMDCAAAADTLGVYYTPPERRKTEVADEEKASSQPIR